MTDNSRILILEKLLNKKKQRSSFKELIDIYLSSPVVLVGI